LCCVRPGGHESRRKRGESDQSFFIWYCASSLELQGLHNTPRRRGMHQGNIRRKRCARKKEGILNSFGKRRLKGPEQTANRKKERKQNDPENGGKSWPGTTVIDQSCCEMEGTGPYMRQISCCEAYRVNGGGARG